EGGWSRFQKRNSGSGDRIVLMNDPDSGPSSRQNNQQSRTKDAWISLLTSVIGPTVNRQQGFQPLLVVEQADAEGRPDSSFHCFDAVRALDRQGNRKLNDGSQLLRYLWLLSSSESEAKPWKEFRRHLSRRLNAVFSGAGIPEIQDIEMKGPANQGIM